MSVAHAFAYPCLRLSSTESEAELRVLVPVVHCECAQMKTQEMEGGRIGQGWAKVSVQLKFSLTLIHEKILVCEFPTELPHFEMKGLVICISHHSATGCGSPR